MLKRLMLSLAVVVPTVIAGAAITTPAEAQYHRPAPERHYRPHRKHCWVKRERVRVWTTHGPRWTWRSVRVCR
jgi:hypothetical protein